ncbi:sigma-54 dependent transcriptional regulator [soil metagenome]
MAERARLLIVYDDADVLAYSCEVLEAHYDVAGERSSRAALQRIWTEEFDIILTDVEMPEVRGPDLLAAILDIKPRQAVLMMTAFGSVELAVASVRSGASDFVTKPFKLDALLVAIERTLRERMMRLEIVRLRRDLADEDNGLVATTPQMTAVLDVSRRVSRSDVSVLITGESGVGKSAVARWIHDRSARRNGPFVQINCAALPAPLVEAELFGVHRGAFTDARDSRRGLFEEAAHGTLFLDEIAEMPIEAQAKLLQVLETSRVRRVGGTEQIETDIRIITATNRDLEKCVSEGRFRKDLYFRINVVRIDIPPLRSRQRDIVALVHSFLARAARIGEAPVGITEEAMHWLCAQEWRGNVRELANKIERAVALAEHDTLVLDDVRETPASTPEPDALDLGQAADQRMPLRGVEVAYIRHIVALLGGNVVQAARVLGIDRRTLFRKLGGSL